MRVTLCSFDTPGSLSGPNSWLLRTVPEFEKAGISCEVIFVASRPNDCTNIQNVISAGIRTSVIDSSEFPSTERQVYQILSICAERRPDVFVANIVLPALFAGRWLRKAGIPTIGVLRADNEFYTAMMDQFVFGLPEYRLSAVVCVSELLENEVLRRNPLNTAVLRIPSGTQLPEVLATPPVSTLRLVYLGRLQQEQKRICELTQALCRATREIPGVEADIFGHGKDRPSVEKLLGSEGVGLPVRLRGRVGPADVLDVLRTRHALVLMSDYEGTPVAVMEAMAAGVVPICLWIRSGVPELVEDGVTGLLIRDRQDEFVRAVRRLREEPGLWQRLSTAARLRIEGGFSQQVVTKRWIDLLTTIARSDQNPGEISLPQELVLPPVNPAFAPWDHREPPYWRLLAQRSKRASKRILQRFTKSRIIHQISLWARYQTGAVPSNPTETLYRLNRFGRTKNASKVYSFPWGEFHYTRLGQLRVQYEEIFVHRRYAFSPINQNPVIMDCGGNMGLSAVWFKMSYPRCDLRVYEADPDLAVLIENNIRNAALGPAKVFPTAVWVNNGVLGFKTTGDDKGAITLNGSREIPCIDLAEHIPESVDLLKLDVEGAEFEILKHVCDSGAIRRVRCLICELHVVRDRTDDLLLVLQKLSNIGMKISFTADIVPWIGSADIEAPFETVKRKHVLAMLYAWWPA